MSGRGEAGAVGATPRQVACPCCGKPARFDPSNAHRPFCSARCKAIDLGDWAAERHRIRGEALPDAEELDSGARAGGLTGDAEG